MSVRAPGVSFVWAGGGGLLIRYQEGGALQTTIGGASALGGFIAARHLEIPRVYRRTLFFPPYSFFSLLGGSMDTCMSKSAQP